MNIMTDRIAADAETTLMILVSVQFLLTLCVLALQAWRLLRKDPPLHEVYATKAEVIEYRADMAEKLSRLQSRVENNAHEEEARAAKIHERVNLILASVCRIEGACRAKQREGGCP